MVSPAKTIGRIGIPKVEKEIKSIRINGKVAWISGKYNKTEGLSGAGEDHDFVYFSGVQPGSCDQTMTVNIVLEQTNTYQIALYLLDWDNKGRTTAVEMFDLQTKNLIAPVKIVRDYFGGKYLVFKYTKSVRFRIDQVRGVNAALSGIFFD